jgi:hypothetical protein
MLNLLNIGSTDSKALAFDLESVLRKTESHLGLAN